MSKKRVTCCFIRKLAYRRALSLSHRLHYPHKMTMMKIHLILDSYYKHFFPAFYPISLSPSFFFH
ncbi:hypothetical protein BDB00DRAFT_808157 [Zychaea mexicana]|uniref:uncharacterized protein n=1 Tax=Zychaea mexicana TaxID=64656 RepID=UPI0022FEE996|nr:uncharacterized protein BDB00DRAFT_808157 [Zychaea mexicana]KAI9496634.1 hypothetical protein BDB00DRAFT_808157 [Zychaea mexicana]